MALLEIVKYPDAVLERTGDVVTEFDARLKKLVADMFETMYAARGVGLAAPQVGVSQRLFVMDCPREDGKADKLAIINPEIILVEGSQLGDEGCLSFPDVYFPVKREMRAIVRAQDVNGEWFEFDSTELSARCILHETDHCDGIVFINHTTPLKRQMVKRKMRRFKTASRWV